MDEIGDMTDAVKDLDDALGEGMEDIDSSGLAVAEPSNEYRRPWDHQDNESIHGYELFVHYRNQGLSRTFLATSEYAFEHQLGMYPKDNLEAYSRSVVRYRDTQRWNERCFAYDVEQERLYQMARSEAIREMAERHEVQIEKAINGLMTPIDALTKAMSDDPEFMSDLSKMDKKKLVSLANLAARTIPSLMAAERLSRGMPTEIVSGVVEHQHIHSVDRDQIGAVLEVLGQAGVLNVGNPDSESGDIVDAEVVEVHSVSAEGDD